MTDWIKYENGEIRINLKSLWKIYPLRYTDDCSYVVKNADTGYSIFGIPVIVDESLPTATGTPGMLDIWNIIPVPELTEKERAELQANHEMLLKRYNVPEHFENVRFGVHGYFYDSVPGMDPEGDEISAFFVKYGDSHENVDVKANLLEAKND